MASDISSYWPFSFVKKLSNYVFNIFMSVKFLVFYVYSLIVRKSKVSSQLKSSELEIAVTTNVLLLTNTKSQIIFNITKHITYINARSCIAFKSPSHV